MPVKLGLGLTALGSQLDLPLAQVRHAERLGFDIVWTAEAYGGDGLTPLAWLAGQTERIRLGTSVLPVAARPPTTAAMSINTLDALAGRGRAVLGLGVSGPQVVEGWFGQPWGKPARRMRDYVDIVRKVLRREEKLTSLSRDYPLPYQGPGAAGLGKPLKSILHTNPDIPILLGTGSDTMVRLTAEIADGWLTFGFTPGSMSRYGPLLEEGFRRAGGGKSLDDFEIVSGVELEITDDIEAAWMRRKPQVAMLVGGMGHEQMNFHRDRMERAGFAGAAAEIQEHFLRGAIEDAIAAVPDEFVDDGALIGPLSRIEERFAAWRSSGVTSLTLYTDDFEAMEMVAALAAH